MHTHPQPELLERAATLVRGARHAIAFTGAGISVPSGIPDFRSPGGLWSRFDPMAVASIQALAVNPTAVWEFLLDAIGMFSNATPNPAHLALTTLQRAGRLKEIVTQNIDGLHQAAGSADVIEFHGGCTRFYCMRCQIEYSPELAKKLTRETIPWRCDACGGVVRPNVVFFGEGIPPEAYTRASEAAHAADLAIIVGTSGDVSPANTIPLMVKGRGGSVIEINLGQTSFGRVSDIRFDAKAEIVLPALLERVANG